MNASVSLRLAGGRASCALWLDDCPHHAGLATACIGALRCDDAESGRVILDRALENLVQRGFEYAIGPMDGDTWHTYRLVSGSDGSPAFPFEPANPVSHAEAFSAFDVIARYTSARAETSCRRDTNAYADRLRAAGIRVRTFDRRRADEDLLAIYRLSLAAFADNFLYTPIDEAAFMDLYRPLVEGFDPSLILLAEDESLQAFLFAFAHGRTAVVKTCASATPGLGAFLLEQFHRGPAARYDFVVHALMHEHNVSQCSSRKYARTFRRYALYGRHL
jgi:hypothetical protein